jgi:hypothetical protein
MGAVGLVLAAAGLSGCGSDPGMSAQDEANLKMHDASKTKPPTAEQMKTAGRFHSSLQESPGGAPAGGPPGVPGAPGANK